MKTYIVALISILVSAGVAFCQVDTMRLIEVGSITAPGNITNWYFEDLNADSIKEIILTTPNSVNIYNGQTYAPIWSQAGFTSPKDLNFADINNDGLVDFSVKDTSHIYLIDPHHSTTIWTSPALDSLYRCYEIGDRNDDGWEDMALVTKTPFIYTSAVPDTDTIWVDIYDGPYYQLTDRFYAFSINIIDYRPGRGYESYDIPKKFLFSKQLVNGSIETRYLLFITTNYEYHEIAPYSRYYTYGNITLFNPAQPEFIKQINNSGDYIDKRIVAYLDTLKFYAVFGTTNHESTPYWDYESYLYEVKLIEDDTSESIDTLWNRSYTGEDWFKWIGFIIGDIDPSVTGDELFFGDTDSLCLKAFPSMAGIWSTNSEAPEGNQWVIACYHKLIETAIDSNLIILAIKGLDSTIKYKFIEASSGQFGFVILSRLAIKGVFNATCAHDDLLYGVTADTLHFYALAPRVGIDDPEAIPSAFFLSPNYPNPFNSSTLIEYGLQSPGPVKIDIFDILGRKVQALADETQAAGYYQVTWKADNVPSGIYFYRIQAGEKTQTRKCLLLK
jgi:hypothetical protein